MRAEVTMPGARVSRWRWPRADELPPPPPPLFGRLPAPIFQLRYYLISREQDDYFLAAELYATSAELHDGARALPWRAA